MKTLYNPLIASVALIVLSLSAPHPVAAQSDQDNTAPVRWNWFVNVSSTTLNDYLVQNNYRITDLQVVMDGKEPRFDAIVVKNTGTYAKRWLWYPALTGDQVLSIARAHQYRPTVVAPYLVNGALRFAVSMISNTGNDASVCWLFNVRNAAELNDFMAQHNARLIQIKPYGSLATRTQGYIALAVPKDKRHSVVWTNVPYEKLRAPLGYRLVEVVPDFNRTYTVLADDLQAPTSSWIKQNSFSLTPFMRPISLVRDGIAYNGNVPYNFYDLIAIWQRY